VGYVIRLLSSKYIKWQLYCDLFSNHGIMRKLFRSFRNRYALAYQHMGSLLRGFEYPHKLYCNALEILNNILFKFIPQCRWGMDKVFSGKKVFAWPFWESDHKCCIDMVFFGSSHNNRTLVSSN
jgi:hypothetical protein